MTPRFPHPVRPERSRRAPVRGCFDVARRERRGTLLPALLFVTLAACSGPAPVTEEVNATSVGVAPATPVAPRTSPTPAAAAAAATSVPDRYVGRWTGVEGMYLDIKTERPGRYTLDMQWDLDNKGVFTGIAEGDTIVFDRRGARRVLRPTDGDATGLKYLAGKKDCLTVASGEGYCRD